MAPLYIHIMLYVYGTAIAICNLLEVQKVLFFYCYQLLINGKKIHSQNVPKNYFFIS